MLGGAMLDGETLPETFVKIPLKTMNRHGLIAGATGTGKTKSLQVLAENLSNAGVPVLVMDIKGDLSGLGQPSPGHPKIDERMNAIGAEWKAEAYPLEILTLSEQDGTRLRATVSEFGPVLISRILDLNATQSGIISLVFKWCDDQNLPLLDLDDLRKVLQFVSKEGKEEIEAEYGRVSSASTGTILRKIIELEEQGADMFFGERSFEVDDLLRTTEDGRGVINILRLTDIQGKPKLFSTFMLCMMAEIYSSFEEQGDSDKPKLVIFIDEAHLMFDEASKTLVKQIETMVKLIRSKGVGLYFCTQIPSDVPDEVLSQLGMKIQHALRAFTAKDRKKIKMTAENFPLTDHYEVDEVLTTMGIGEALVTVLNEKGIPTPLAVTMMSAPRSRMDILTDKELKDIISASELHKKYAKDINRESAYEILTDKIEEAAEKEAQIEEEKELKKEYHYQRQKRGKKTYSYDRTKKKRSTRSRKPKSTMEEMIDSTVGRQVSRTVARELTRGLLGVLGLGGRSRR